MKFAHQSATIRQHGKGMIILETALETAGLTYVFPDGNGIKNIAFQVKRGEIYALYNALVHGEGNYQITAAIEEAQTVITIKNASSSIQQEDIPHLFDRFYTTDQSRTKTTTGLGLAIAQRLVTRMGGQIVASLQNGIFAIQVVFPIVNS